MQHKLATWAQSDPTRRFDRLLRLIADQAWLAEAARVVLASSGAHTPGIDGMDKQRMQTGLAEHLASLHTDLSGNYTPQPVKRIYIPKANGKKRPLGIPTLKDRIVQRAMLMVMEPIWESDFHRLSYGFRPERSVHHAVRTVKIQLQDTGAGTRGRWIIEGDLASYFDTVHHRLLLRCVRRRIRDDRFVDLLRRFLKAGALLQTLVTAGQRHPVWGSGSIGKMLIEHVHGLGHDRGANAKCSFDQTHLSPDPWLQAPCPGLPLRRARMTSKPLIVA
jgi:retron-type reverse transcriptase